MAWASLLEIIENMYFMLFVNFTDAVIEFLSYEVDLAVAGTHSILELILGVGVPAFLVAMITKWLIGIIT